MLKCLLLLSLIGAFSVVHADDSNGAMWGTVIERIGDYPTTEVVTAPTVSWTRTFPAAVTTTPAASLTTVYVATSSGVLYALDRKDGSTLWEQQLATPTESSCALDVVNNRLYIGAGNGLHAFDATTGEALWHYPATGPVLSSPAVSADVVYVCSNDRRIVALAGANGVPIWLTFVSQGLTSSPCINVGDGLVYANGLDGFVYALNVSDGALAWSYDTDALLFESPALMGGRLFITDGFGRLIAFDPTDGDVLWQTTPVYIGSPSPSAAHGQVYASVIPSVLSAFDAASGVVVWEFNSSHPIQTRSVSTPNAIYFANLGGVLYGIDPTTGDELWSFALDNAPRAAPSVNNGELFIGTGSGTLYALQ